MNSGTLRCLGFKPLFFFCLLLERHLFPETIHSVTVYDSFIFLSLYLFSRPILASVWYCYLSLRFDPAILYLSVIAFWRFILISHLDVCYIYFVFLPYYLILLLSSYIYLCIYICSILFHRYLHFILLSYFRI